MTEPTGPAHRILVVEDDSAISRALRDALTFEGFDVRLVSNGNAAIRAAKEFSPDLVLLDLMLPGRHGFELCKLWYREFSIIIITAKSQKADELSGLSLGADDYVTKPFDLEKLLARIHAVLRRTRRPVEHLRLGAITIDFSTRQAWKDRRLIDMPHREFELLQYLAERSDRVVYRDELLCRVWGYADPPKTRSVDFAINRLRKKIEPDPRHPRFIHTAHGDGYYLTPGGRQLEPRQG